MADTLKSLAGGKFKIADVITALHAPLQPEELVLGSYVFMPHARAGIAAALNTPFSWTLPARASVNLRVPVLDDRGGMDAEMTVRVYGPGDVTEIDPSQVIRVFPEADVSNAEVDALVHVEFDRPDLPWLFTPAGPDANGRLVPWLTLVVAERRYIDWGEARGAVRPARIRRDQLQPLHDAWAWAHAQVIGLKGANAEAEPTLERRLSDSNAQQNLSRLVCPRRLDDRVHYVACVVPTFLAGVQRGLGIAPTSTLAPAWGTRDDFLGGDPFDMVALPVYFSWSFGTADEGDFESLARKLRPAVAPPGVGRRRVDASHAAPGLEIGAGDPGSEIVVTGPVVSPQAPKSEPLEQWPSEGQQIWPADVTKALIDMLNRPDQQAHAAEPGPPVVAPPLYGGMHARQSRIEVEEAAAAAQPPWFRELNLNPADRIVAGVGTRVVQAEQQDLMLEAWNQVLGIEASNRALRLAQLAMHVGASLHRRHLARLSDAAVVAVTERVHGKVLDIAGRSVWNTIRASSLPLSVTSGAFRRLLRARGPVAAAAVRIQAQRALAVDRLTVDTDRFTSPWLVDYKSPDGIRATGGATARLVDDALATRIRLGSDAAGLLQRWQSDLARPTTPDRLTARALDHALVRQPDDLRLGLLTALVDRLLGTMPDARAMEGDPEAALTGACHVALFRTFAGIAAATGRHDVPVRIGDAKRLRLAPLASSDDPARMLASIESLLALAGSAEEFARAHRVAAPAEDQQRSAARMRELITPSLQLNSATLVGALREIGRKVVLDDPFVEAARDRVDAPALALVAKLAPALTVPARVLGRLHGGSGRMPSWLRSDWFADGRVEPVMAHPRFRYPMYEPLHRYDREWMVPGLGLIERPDMATILQTNNRFIEAYLTGLNHEMARELLWQEFPTDQRGTYFSSFWSGAPEIVADMHEAAWRGGTLGSHVDQALNGQLVFLVRGDLIRRYPGVVAHAALEQNLDPSGIPTFAAATPVRTLFHVFLPPNVLLVGFSMTRARIDQAGEKWWFTLSENPTEPRFGLDPSRPTPAPTRDNLVWDDFGVGKPGQFLDATRHTNIVFDAAQWGASSASVAYLLFQLPARAAFLAKSMVQKATH
jgi:hypothetical protein